MTQRQMADRLGVTQTAVSYWETGRRDIGLRDLCRYVEVIGLQVAFEPDDGAADVKP